MGVERNAEMGAWGIAGQGQCRNSVETSVETQLDTRIRDEGGYFCGMNENEASVITRA